MSIYLVSLALIAVFGVAVAWRVFFIEYPRSAVDATRNELFEIRDRLFELANSGEVSFDNRGYKAARELVNGMIKYAHDVSAIHLFFANRLAGDRAKQLRKAVNASIQRDLDSLPKSAKKSVSALLAEASEAMARLVVFRSVGLSCAFAIYTLIHATAICFRELIRIARHRPAPKPEPEHHRNSVQESMDEAISHGPMKRVPTMIRREASRYTSRMQAGCTPAMLQAA